MKRSILSLLIIMIVLGMGGCGPKVLSVSDAWARPGIVGGNSAVYFVIHNPTNQSDTLLSISSAVAKTAEIHLSKQNADGTISMEMQDTVPVPAREDTAFKPVGLHVMLIDLPKELQIGDTFPLILRFQKAGEIKITVEVREP